MRDITRTHWLIPSGAYTQALLTLRWAGNMTATFNGQVVWNGGSGAPANPSPVGGNQNTQKFEKANIDVTALLKPGEDNVLAIMCERDGAVAGPGGWSWGGADWIGRAAKLAVR